MPVDSACYTYSSMKLCYIVISVSFIFMKYKFVLVSDFTKKPLPQNPQKPPSAPPPNSKMKMKLYKLIFQSYSIFSWLK